MLALWVKKAVLLAALLVMPLQGVAAGMALLLCHGDAQAHAAHDGGGHDHGPQQGDHHDEGGAGGNYHLCCHLSVSAPAATELPAALPDFPVRAFTPDTLHDLFFPEQPQRPPLA